MSCSAPDGFGRSDGREALRAHFEVDRKSIAVAALKRARGRRRSRPKTVGDAITQLGIDPEKRNPRHRVSFFFGKSRRGSAVVPDLGDFADVEIIEILVKPGDDVARGAGPRHARDREGDDGRAVAVCRSRRQAQGESGRRVSTGDVILSLGERGAGAAPARPRRGRQQRMSMTTRPCSSRKWCGRRTSSRCAHAGDRTVASQPAPAAPQTVVVPDLGDFAEVEIIEILVQPGDEVSGGAGSRHTRDRESEHGRARTRCRQDHRAQGEERGRVSAGDALLVLQPSGAAAVPAEAAQGRCRRAAADQEKGASVTRGGPRAKGGASRASAANRRARAAPRVRP